MSDSIKGRGKWIQNTVAQTGEWPYITTLSDVTIDSMTCGWESTGSSTFSGMVIPAGLTLRVDATSIKLQSGDLIAYHK